MVRYTVDPSMDLDGDADIESIVKGFSDDQTIKGLLFARFVAMLGDAFWAMRPVLRRWPEGGQYRMREEYPQADYARIAFAVAARYFPHVSPLEAVRRIARQDYHGFMRTALGRAFLAILGDVTSTFMHYPVIYPLLINGITTRSELADGGVRVTQSGYIGTTAYALGSFEGFVLAFGYQPIIAVNSPSPTTTVFDIRWS